MTSHWKRLPIIQSLACLGMLALTQAAWADLEFREVAADAHTVLSGQALVHRFAFKNAAGFTEIVGVRTSCGCLDAKPTKTRFGPGESGDIELTINTLGQSPGAHRWVVRVTERGDRGVKETALELTAEVKAEVSVQPASLEIYTEGRASHELVLTDTRPRPLAITRLLTSSQALGASFEPIRAQAGSWRISVSLGATLPEGRHHETLIIVTNDGLYRELRVPITIKKHALHRVAAFPSTLTITAGRDQPLPAPIILLRDTLQDRVRIDSLACDSKALSCRWATGPGNSVTLRVQVDRSKVEGDSLESQITIKLASPRSESIVVPVHCTIR